MKKLLLLFGILLISLFRISPLAAQATNIYISEIMYDSPLQEDKFVFPTDHNNGEYIKLFNPTNHTIDISGWILKGTNVSEQFVFPAGTTLDAQTVALVAYKSNNSFSFSDFYHLGGSNVKIINQSAIILYNKGELVSLYDTSANVIDAIAYGNMAPNSNSVLFAHNGVGKQYNQLMSLHRTQVSYEKGLVVSLGNSDMTYALATPLAGGNAIVNNTTPAIAPITPVIDLKQLTGQNYIITSQPLVEKSISTLGASDELTTFQYFDGLGRPTETVQKGITPLGKDLVTLTEYDGLGREFRHWLPITGDGSGDYLNPTAFTINSNTLYGNETNLFSETILESSPLDRVMGQKSPGAWNSHPTANAYQMNVSSDIIACFFVNSSNQLERFGNYTANTLFKTTITDEDGKTSTEYKDLQGQVVMKRNNSNVDTYYVYNDLGQLCYVLPPLAADALSSQSVYTDNTDALIKYAYLYQFDERGNCTYKRLPGCAPVYMVYDKADRLVLSQDGNQRAKATKQWTVTKYDVFGRLLYTGLITNSSTRSALDSIYSGSVTNETYSGSGTTGGYTCTNLAPVSLLTVNYYDSYGFLSYSGNNPGSMLTSTTLSGYDNPAATTYAKTLLTGTRVYHLDNSALFEVTALYYDKYGRVVQSRASNHLGGYDLVYNALDFTGKPTKTYKTHGINGASATITELYTYVYDKAQRLLTTTYSLNGGSTVTLAANTYDELGRLQVKVLGNVDATTYAYNVRSWTTGITGSRFSENLYYNANPLSSNVCFNGNIAGMQWSVPSENLGYNRSYTFGYDGLNRLTDATYCGFNGSVVSGTLNRYNEHFWFDKMGNTTTFTRNGLLSSSGGYGTVDNLNFTYNGNQKVKIVDSGTNGIFYGDEEFVQNGTNTGNSCAYDANGNRLYDSNSNIWGIRYNTLNLPDAMQFYQGHQTNYTYSAAGAKLKVIDKTAPAGVVLPVTSLNTILSNPSVSTITTTDYVGNIIYENATLKRILTPVGYWQAGTFYYFLKDHLGSNRVVINGSGGIAETSSYYPSGMRFGESAVNGGSIQPYRHTGMEMQEMHGLNWIDNLARFRTVSDGDGFTGRDPLCEMKPWQSPYMYCSGNPVNRTDPTGLYDLPEVTVTAPAPKNNNNSNFNFAFQQLLDDANRNTPQIPRITPPTPTFNLPTNPNANNVVINNKDSKKGDGTIETISTALSSVGIAADGAEIYTVNNAGKEIVYVTLKGTTAAVNATKVISVLKRISTATIVVGIAVDFIHVAADPSYAGKAIVNTGVTIVATIIAGTLSAPAGLVIGGGYLLLDQLGAFDRPTNIPYYNSPVCPQDNTKINIPYK